MDNLQLSDIQLFNEAFVRNLNTRLDSLNLSVRTTNCLRFANIHYVGELANLSTYELMTIPNFGKKCLQEINNLLNGMNLHLGLGTLFVVPEVEIPTEEAVPPLEDTVALYIEMGLLRSVDTLGLSVRNTNCLRNEKITYIGDLVVRLATDLLKVPSFGRTSLKELQDKLTAMKLHFGMKLHHWPLANIEELVAQQHETLARNHEESLLEALSRTLEKVKMNDRNFHILQSRLGLNGKPRTLEDTASDFGITRERIRQIQKKVTLAILKEEFWDDVLRIRLKGLLANRGEPLYLDNLHREDAWFIGFEDNLPLLENVISGFSDMDDLNFLTVSKRRILTFISPDTWHYVRYDLLNMLEQSLDMAHSMGDIEMFIESRLRKYKASELSSLMYDMISEDLNFTIVDGDFILASIGNTLASHARLLLEAASQPLHMDEILRLYEERVGIPASPRSLQGCLNNNDFCVYAKSTYGLMKHLGISTDEQNQIREDLENTILQGPSDRQWHLREVVAAAGYSKLDKFKAQIILESSAKLRYLGRGLWKEKSADDEMVNRMHIRKAVFDALKTHGGPMHIDELRESVSQTRGVGEFFNLHPNEVFSRVDASVWGLLERDFCLDLGEQIRFKEYFADQLSQKGVAMHKSELLVFTGVWEREELSEGQVFGILLSDARFKSWHGGLIGLASWKIPGKRTFTEVMKDIAASVEGSITTDAIVSQALDMLGYSFNKHTISSYLNRFGLMFDPDYNVWRRA